MSDDKQALRLLSTSYVRNACKIMSWIAEIGNKHLHDPAGVAEKESGKAKRATVRVRESFT